MLPEAAADVRRGRRVEKDPGTSGGWWEGRAGPGSQVAARRRGEGRTVRLGGRWWEAGKAREEV